MGGDDARPARAGRGRRRRGGADEASGGVPRAEARLYPTAADCAGWACTEGIPPGRACESETVVHFAGGWARRNAAGEAFAANRVCYVPTNVEGGLGRPSAVRHRLVDCGGGGLFELEAAGDAEGNAALFRYPLTFVGPAFAMQLQDAGEFLALGDGAEASTELLEGPRAVQAGRRGVSISVGYRMGEQRARELILAALVEDEGWKIAARSGAAVD